MMRPSGVTRCVIEETLALRSLGNDVRILPILSNPFFKFRGNYQLNMFKLAIDFLISRLKPLKITSDFKPDIVISHNFAEAQRIEKLRPQIKFALFLHDPGTFYPYAGFGVWFPSLTWKFEKSGLPLVRVQGKAYKKLISKEKRILEKADLVFVNSKKSYQNSKKIYGIDFTAIVLHYGANPQIAVPKCRGDFVLIGGTALELGRNYELAFKAAATANAKVILAGRETPTTGQVLNELKKYVKDYEVIISDFQPYHNQLGEMERLFSSARVYINASEESFAIRTLEAASYGCPIIQNSNCGSSELFKHGVDGFFPKKQDVKLYASYIADLMADERKAWRMGKHAWETLKQKYTWEMHAKRLLNFLENVV